MSNEEDCAWNVFFRFFPFFFLFCFAHFVMVRDEVVSMENGGADGAQLERADSPPQIGQYNTSLFTTSMQASDYLSAFIGTNATPNKWLNSEQDCTLCLQE